MKTLIAQIYEAGKFHANAVTQKRGLVNAFAAYGDVLDWDYLDNDADTRYQGMVNRLAQFNPDVVFTQFHGADVITAAQVRTLKNQYPQTTFVNWSGDSWSWSLTAPAMLELAREYDLWLVAAPDALPVYAEHGIASAFFQIAYEPPPLPLPDMPAYDVVFLGNIISDKRRALLEFLRSLDGVNVGIYGDWERANGHNTYDFAAGESLYKNATLALADCAYPEQTNYISNRPFHALAAGGALLLHQRVERMDILSGLQAGIDYVEWADFDNLRALITEWLKPENAAARTAIVTHGQAFVLANHTWDVRVRMLLTELLPKLAKVNA